MLTNSFCGEFNDLLLEDLNDLETMICLHRILKFTIEIDIKTSKDAMYDYVFSEFNLHFFDMDINFDTNISKP